MVRAGAFRAAVRGCAARAGCCATCFLVCTRARARLRARACCVAAVFALPHTLAAAAHARARVTRSLLTVRAARAHLLRDFGARARQFIARRVYIVWISIFIMAFCSRILSQFGLARARAVYARSVPHSCVVARRSARARCARNTRAHAHIRFLRARAGCCRTRACRVPFCAHARCARCARRDARRRARFAAARACGWFVRSDIGSPLASH